MDIETMKYYGLTKELDKADYFETDCYQSMLTNIKHAVRTGGIIAITGIVGVGKTVTLRRIQQAIKTEDKVLISRSLADKRYVTINTLYTALFADLVTKKDFKLPTQAEKRERKLQVLIKELNKPIALFIDEAHDLHPRTLISLKHLIETVQDVNGILSIIIVGHPKLANDLRNPALEEIGARAKLFELSSLGMNSPKFIEWIISNCSTEKIKPHDILTQETIELLAERLITPLQITYYLTRILERGFNTAKKPIDTETAELVLAPDLKALEPNLARQGYNLSVLCDYLGARRKEVRAYFRGQLPPSRCEELNKEIYKLGIVV
jgi:type II secretory pathway predicted ATPase ExeA